MYNAIFSFQKQPSLTLVGAGPGDPELITLKAVKALEAADIVLYDALVSKEILALIPSGTPLISVGKRAGMHSHSQEEINSLIVQTAFLYGHVVRLKGGDPFVFGRATEEIECAARYGIPTRVIPGISSALSVPAAVSIPLTSRGVSESFWVVTGTTMTGGLSGDVALAAQSTATVIILMGLKKLAEIMALFRKYGKGETPVAVIQNGTLPTQKHVVGTVSTIVNLVKEEDLGSPGIIIAGDVVKFADVSNGIAANYLKVE
ncbi:MAG: uroporphyrinogen-III C-methyltransferase [Cyclobacteriaceae bacterium]